MVEELQNMKICDYHIHIGQFNETYYDYHDVFNSLKLNAVEHCVCAYLTPRFDSEKIAIQFYESVVHELGEAQCFAESLKLDVKFLYWADPLVLQHISLEKIFGKFKYFGIAIHPGLHIWSKEYSELLTEIFIFANKNNIPIFIHTGVSAYDEPLQFEKWFADFPTVEVHLAHCKDSKPIIMLFERYTQIYGDTAFCPKDSYEEICAAGFMERMLFGTDFPITHYYQKVRNNSIKENANLDELKENYKALLAESSGVIYATV